MIAGPGIRILLSSIFFLFITEWGRAQVEPYIFADTIRAQELLDSVKIYIKQRAFDKAKSSVEVSKTIYEQVLGQNSKESALAYHLIGVIHYSLGEYDKALLANQTALNRRQVVFGREHIDVAGSLNNLGVVCHQKGDYGLAAHYFEEALALKIKLLGPKHQQVFSTLNNLGSVYIAAGQFEKSISHFESQLNLSIEIYGEEHPLVAKSLSNLAIVYKELGYNKEAIEYNERAINMYRKTSGEETVEIAQAFNNIGIIYSQMGDTDKGVFFNQKALALRLKILGENHPDVAISYRSFAASLDDKGDASQSMEYHKKALNIETKMLGEEHPLVLIGNVNIASVLIELQDYSSAAAILEKIIEVQKSKLGKSYYYLASTYYQMGKCLLPLKKNKQAFDCFYEALKIRTLNFGLINPETATSYYSLSHFYEETGDFEKAMVYIDSTLISLNYLKNKSFQETNSIPLLELTFRNGLEISNKWFEKTKRPDLLYKSRYFAKMAAQTLQFQAQRISPASKSDLSGLQNSVYLDAVNINQELHQYTDSVSYLTESFDFAERSKAFLLYEALQESRALKFADIPDSLLQQEYDLRIDIAYYDKKRQEKLSAGASDTDSAVFAISSKRFDLNRRYEALKQRFEKDYPKYFKARYDLSAVAVADVRRELLQPGQSLLEYLVGDSAVYIFVVRRDTFIVKEIKRDFPLEQWVNEMTRDGIYGFYALPQEHPDRTAERLNTCDKNYTRAARHLYRKLYEPVAGQLTERVIIVPDGMLSYVPFEALLTKDPPRPGAFASYPGSYLLDRHQISYCYSATLLREMRGKPEKYTAKGSLLAMAPFFRGDTTRLWNEPDSAAIPAGSLRDRLGPLKASGREVAVIAKNWNGAPFYGKDASAEKFRELAGQYRILHLSTHGKADDRQGDYAFLAFSTASDTTFSKLYARDLYNFSLQADLVMLSACETGIGQLKKGEGIVSLARAFAYAGAKSIFTTLWKVSDEKTIDLTVPFYRYLQKGRSKDEALRQAKLDYLEKYKGRGIAVHPFFWAGMIGVGDMEALR